MKIIIVGFLMIITGYLYSLPGDVDMNGKIDIIDALRIARHYVGFTESPFDRTVADVTADGIINIVDALLVAQYWAELIPFFPSTLYKILPVAVVKQEPNMCGPACALMYSYYQKKVYGSTSLVLPSQSEIYTQMRAADPQTSTAPGVTDIGLCSVLNGLLYKYTTVAVQNYTKRYVTSNTTVSDTSAVKTKLTLLKSYEPSIVFWYTTTSTHFVVMTGYDANKDEILFNDPALGISTQLKLSDWIVKEYNVPSKARCFIAKN